MHKPFAEKYSEKKPESVSTLFSQTPSTAATIQNLFAIPDSSLQPNDNFSTMRNIFSQLQLPDSVSTNTSNASIEKQHYDNLKSKFENMLLKSNLNSAASNLPKASLFTRNISTLKPDCPAPLDWHQANPSNNIFSSYTVNQCGLHMLSLNFYEQKLLHILQSTTLLSNEAILDKIKSEFSDFECQSKAFIRALVTAVCRNCLSFFNGLERIKFRNSYTLLTKFTNKNKELEIEALLAIQALDHKTQHQKGFFAY